jgi:proton-dependent oligopeptide transporter, POT family
MGAASTDRSDTAFFGHPRGLATLFFTEMWERFSFYGMKAFLVFYLSAEIEDGGLGFGPAATGIIYGVYTSAVYLTGVPGGWIADRFLGLRRAVLYGGVLIMLGHIVLALPIGSGFYPGLALIVLGTGLLKPNVSAIVGQLYAQHDIRRDAGYSLYYMGINLGAFVAPIVCGYLAQDTGFRAMLADAGLDPNLAWHFGFGAAAAGMAAGLLQFALGTKHLKGAGEHPTPPRDAAEAARDRLILIAILLAIPALVAGFYALSAAGVIENENDFGVVFGAFLTVLSVTLFTVLYIKGCQNRDERRRLMVILALFLGATVFWGCFEQAGSVLNLFAGDYADLEILGFEFPPSWLQSVNSVFIILLAPVFAAVWLVLARRKKEPSAPAKFGIGLIQAGLGFAVMIPAALAIEAGAAKVTFLWLIGLYFLHTTAELSLSPVGLSSMSKLAPARWGGLVMGIWFLASANGSFLAGRAVGLSASMTPSRFFLMMVMIPAAIGVVFLLLAGPLKRLLGPDVQVSGLPARSEATEPEPPQKNP